ncbi:MULTISPECIES: phosphatase PAP2 family protein [Rhizobium]|uniref:Phosphatase PAP2 family protein n=1 Tax=Rhizobium phaseoli TaxID=396 RepID=A0A192THE9_9HYPH|nr:MULTISPECIES: phosphatase PAP2 family protein [Rhizobium]ANL43170.1 phosphatidic acid phosphatase protein [Rhizobium phaseoli]ANL56169.1 phosphatidic acid phosphatase protein [Rhizobium phaseoli]ANL62156.1 phosphatidic acid phosphatase protein [Rhizobium phaseoli]ANL87569.1 phosphatidic acid phosphatase protein [Rhizobium phaseoli]ANL94078.1 phosphatidic acid phosphatase protein [Rhizobium phaseoli]
MSEVQQRGFWTRLGAYEPLTLITMASIAGGLFVLQRMTSEVLEGETLRFDETILLALRRPGELGVPIGPGWLTHAVGDITSLGGITVLSLMTVLVTVYLLLDRRWPIAIFVFSSVLTGWLASTTLKILVARPRPDIVPHLVEVSDLSFPSGHAMVSAVTYLTLGALVARTQRYRSTRIFVMGAGVFLAVIIGLSRIYLGVHYPTDVFAGWCAGALWALGCWLISKRFVPSRAPDNGAEGDDHDGN